MLYCAKCKLQIRGDKLCCPLCEGRLSGEPENPCFPTLKPPRVSRFTFLRISAFVVVTADVLLGILSYLLGFPFLLNLLILALPLLLLDLVLAIYLHQNLIRMITVQVYLAILLIFGVGLYTRGVDWEMGVVIPILFILLPAATILVGVLQKLSLEDYVIYLVFDCVCAMLQVIPIAIGINSMPIFALITAGAGMIFLAFLLLFRFRDIRGAASKYLNL